MNNIYVFEQKIKDLDRQLKNLEIKKNEIMTIKYRYQEYIRKEKLQWNRNNHCNWINGKLYN